MVHADHPDRGWATAAECVARFLGSAATGQAIVVDQARVTWLSRKQAVFVARDQMNRFAASLFAWWDCFGLLDRAYLTHAGQGREERDGHM